VFDEARVGAGLGASRFGPVRYVAETGSTNDDAAVLLGDPTAAGTVLVAGVQHQGRGRRGRRWEAPPGSGLLFTAVLPRPVPATALWAVPFWCALGVAAGVERETGVRLALQWPNDLLLGTRKACGLLGTSRVAGDRATVGCGIGLNVLRPADGDGVDPGAAYLSDAVAAPSREALLLAILAELDASLERLAEPTEVARAWEAAAGLPGAPYRILIDGEAKPFDAVALRLAPDGGLVVEHAGHERVVSLGDARALR